MKKTYVYYQTGLLAGLLGLNTLSSCGHARPRLGMNHPLTTPTTSTTGLGNQAIPTVSPLGSATLPFNENRDKNLDACESILNCAKNLEFNNKLGGSISSRSSWKECTLPTPTFCYRDLLNLIIEDGCSPERIRDICIKYNINIKELEKGYHGVKKPLAAFLFRHDKLEHIRELIGHGATFGDDGPHLLKASMGSLDRLALILLDNGVRPDPTYPFIEQLIELHDDSPALRSLIQRFISLGADVNLGIGIMSKVTALQVAISKRSSKDFLNFLIDNKADINAPWNIDKVGMDDPLEMSMSHQYGDPPILHLPSVHFKTGPWMDLDYLEFFIRKGANVNLLWKDPNGNMLTPMFAAAMAYVNNPTVSWADAEHSHRPCLELIALLLDDGADIEQPWIKPDGTSTTVMDYAFEHKDTHPKLLALLLKKRAKVDKEKISRSWHDDHFQND